MRLVQTEEEVHKLMEQMPPGTIFSQALHEFRERLYEGTVHLIAAPEVQYDARSDRYLIKYEISGRKHSLKATNAAAEFIATLSTSSKPLLYGFKLQDGVVVDVIAETY